MKKALVPSFTLMPIPGPSQEPNAIADLSGLQQTFFLRLVLCALLLCVFAYAQQPTITTFDVPGAGTAAGQGTFGLGMTPSQEIEGYYIDGNGALHGLVRASNGVITTFDVPEAGSGPGQGTQPESINPAGAITGYYTDSTGLSHGFLRSRDGEVTTFDVPGAGRPASCSPPIICSNGTQGASINPVGEIAGQFGDTSGVFHGFLRSPDGTITTFDAPGAGTATDQGTFVTFTDGINPAGAIAGGYVDTSNVFHAFIRAANGTFTEFAIQGSPLTDNSGINPMGTVTSFYADASSTFHGYVRSRDGTFTLFNVPGAGTGPFQGTEPFNINASGAITGAYIDSRGLNHGFLRTKNGRVTTFDVPGAGTGSGQGTIPAFNNPSNAISGFVIDGNGVAHGFLRMP